MIHLHTRSHYSLLESSLKIDEIVALAKADGQKAAVLSDHRSMFGTMAFFHACRKEGLQPVIGLEFEVRRNENIHPLLLIARNTEGLQNLFRLSTRLMSEEPVIDLEDLKDYAGSCFLLNAGGDDWLERLGHEKDEEELNLFFEDLAAAGDPFIPAVSLQDSPVYRQSNAFFRQFAHTLGLPTVALSRIEYAKDGDEQTVRLLRAIEKGSTVDDPSLPVRKGRWWRNRQEMEALYEKEDLEMSDWIIDQIEDYDLPKASLPVFETPSGSDSESYLRALCRAGLKKRLQSLPGIPAAPYLQRLDHELDVIISMGFADYFLIVWDFIREARKREILVGPGRGSAAGSLVSWCLGISHVDPLKNGLLFERFLNPERISMPDIDTDFPDNRRDEVIEYVHSLYGQYHVAHIVTFARMKARLALRDGARALGLPAREAEKLTSLIPAQPNITLEEVRRQSQAFASLVENSPSLSRLYEMALKIEGFPRHASVHAGGIVLSRDSILEQAPLTSAGASLPAVQFTMEYLEELGLIKFDFLALKNLSILDEMSRRIEQQTGRHLDLLKLPSDDPKVYEVLRRGDTLGIFQLESAGIRSLILRYKPQRFEDIAAILALYRPGPMKSINVFLQARFHPDQRKSIHPLIDGLLAETGGIFLYQEQIMEAARILGGFTLAQADSLRKAMSKKNRDVMESWKVQFVKGAGEKGISAQQAESIFLIMEEFADYGFNKSHSYAYGLIVYQMSWIKARYPLQFYVSCLNGSIGSAAKTGAFLQECRGRGIQTLPVSLNHSGLSYEIEGNALRMPLTLIKGLGRANAQKIISERNSHGPYDDPCLAILRLLNIKIPSAQIQSLIRIGAFEDTGAVRESLLESFDEIVRLADLVILDEEKGWKFAGVTPPSLQPAKPSILQRLSDEKELLGFYVSRHPASIMRSHQPSILPAKTALTREGDMELAGILQSVHAFQTKKGQMMAFATLADDTGEIDLAIMPWLYERLQPILKNGLLVWVRGKKNRPKSVLADRVQPIDPASL